MPSPDERYVEKLVIKANKSDDDFVQKQVDCMKCSEARKFNRIESEKKQGLRLQDEFIRYVKYPDSPGQDSLLASSPKSY